MANRDGIQLETLRSMPVINLSVDSQLRDITRSGLFGGPIDEVRRYAKGPHKITFFVDGELVFAVTEPNEEKAALIYKILRSAMSIIYDLTEAEVILNGKRGNNRSK